MKVYLYGWKWIKRENISKQNSNSPALPICFLCRFLIEDGAKANYAAISANVALAGIEGGHDKYDLYLRYMLN